MYCSYVWLFKFCFLVDNITWGSSSLVTKVGMILPRLHHLKALVWTTFVMHSLDWILFSANGTYQDLLWAILGILPNLTFLKLDKIKQFPLHMMASSNVMLDIMEDTSCTISLAVNPDNVNDHNRSDAEKSSPSFQIWHYNTSCFDCVGGAMLFIGGHGVVMQWDWTFKLKIADGVVS